MSIKLFTERDLQGENPLFPSSQYCNDFILLNMYPDGIWQVDKLHSQFAKMKETAILVARTFGDHETITKLQELDA